MIQTAASFRASLTVRLEGRARFAAFSVTRETVDKVDRSDAITLKATSLGDVDLSPT